jgi:hypothetical protein
MTQHPTNWRQHSARARLARSKVDEAPVLNVVEASDRFLLRDLPWDMPDRHEPDEPPKGPRWWRRLWRALSW